MKILAIAASAVFLPALAWAQTPNEKSDTTQLEAISKKLDEQSAKIDALSQQILKLQEQVSKPGVLIGEPTPTPTSSAAADAARASGNTHTVTGAKLSPPSPSRYKVGVEVLQRFNHIENDRKLQIGQTIMIPNPATATMTPTPTPTPEQSPAPNN